MPGIPNSEPNGWNEYARYVLNALEELNDSQKELLDKVDNNKDDYKKLIEELKLDILQKFANVDSEIKVAKAKSAMRATFISFGIAILPIILMIINLIKN